MTDRTDNPDVRHETSDVNIRAILGFGLGLIVVAVFIHFTVWLLFMFFEGREARRVAAEFPLAVGQESRQPPEPRLQTDPRGDLRDLRQQEDDILSSYGWVNKASGEVRIPIGEAMRHVVARGLPVREEKK
jgi:hypothetical protein